VAGPPREWKSKIKKQPVERADASRELIESVERICRMGAAQRKDGSRIWDGGGNYDPWCWGGMAMHHDTGGAPWACEMWATASRQCEKFEDGKCEAKWDSFGNHSRPISIAGWFKTYVTRDEDLENLAKIN